MCSSDCTGFRKFSLWYVAFLVLLGAQALLAACGYHVAGKSDLLPDGIKTIAVPTFMNATAEFKIEQYMTDAVVRELITRTRYQIVSNSSEADVILHGTIVLVDAIPQNFDALTGRATSVVTITRVHVVLFDQLEGRELYQNPELTHRETYEVSANPEAFVQERDAALRRASRTMASTLVSAVLSGF